MEDVHSMLNSRNFFVVVSHVGEGNRRKIYPRREHSQILL